MLQLQHLCGLVKCRGCAKIKELEVELDQLRLLVAMVEREQMGYASGCGGGTVDAKVGGR